MPVAITLEDHHGNVLHRAKIAEGAPVSRLLPALITSLRLPIIDDAGRPIVYHLSHNGRSLQEEETLADADVQAGDTIVLVPEMTAGNQPDIADQDATEPLVVLEAATHKYEPIVGFPSNYQVDLQAGNILIWFQPDTIQQALAQAKNYPQQEVAGLLAGSIYEEDGRFLVVVEKILEAQHTQAGLTFVTFTDKTWLDLLQQRDASPFPTLGWYHSHPGFGIFLSTSDTFIHRNFFGSQPWYIALVVDPLSGDWGVFTWEGKKIKRCSR